MSDLIHLAVGQFPGATGKAQENLAAVARLSARAAKEGAQFILFPENCLTGYPGDEGGAARVALDAEGAEARRLSDTAHDHGITIAAGFIERRASQFHSAHLVAFDDGSRRIVRKRSVDARDQKIGLTPAEEQNPDFQIDDARAAMAICMDGTDEFFNAAAKRKVRIILHPSGGACAAWAHASDPDAARIDAQEAEGCAKCVEAARQKARRLHAAYLVANTIGYDGERGYPGNSFIISPAGEVLAHLKPTAIIEKMTEGVGVARVSLAAGAK